jgi:NAD+ synthase (glutamine-hydrolysing)
MKITSAQLNFTVGAMEANTSKILEVISQNKDSDWIVFSELSITGYYPMDLLDVKGFIEAQEACIDTIATATRGSDQRIVLGVFTRNMDAGKPWHNSLIIIQDGGVRFTYHKQLLPTYNVFDEIRHFEPGPRTAAVWREEGMPSVGFLLCEDTWNDDAKGYPVNPVADLARESIDLLITINASPASELKTSIREMMISSIAVKYGWNVVYVNQIGGADALVFDGNSFAVDKTGTLVYHAENCREEVGHIQYSKATNLLLASTIATPPTGPAQWNSQIVTGIRDYFSKSGTGFTKAIIGSSGGIDSAVVLALAVQALGAENVIALTMPSGWSSAGSVLDSVELCKNLGVKLIEIPIQPMMEAFSSTFKASELAQEWTGLAAENAQARIRGMTLMGWSNQWGALVLSTGNKSEMSVGYATLYGDMNGAINPLGDLYKMEVYALARWLNEGGREVIPLAIIDKAPSAELAPDQKDEDSLPPYPLLDAVLKLEIEGQNLGSDERDALDATVAPYPEVRREIVRKLDMAEFKRRQAPPIIRVHSRSFGSGWQFPVAQQFKRWTRM